MSREPQSVSLRMGQFGHRPTEPAPKKPERRRFKVVVEGAEPFRAGRLTQGQAFTSGALTDEERQIIAGYRLSQPGLSQDEKNAILVDWKTGRR